MLKSTARAVARHVGVQSSSPPAASSPLSEFKTAKHGMWWRRGLSSQRRVGLSSRRRDMVVALLLLVAWMCSKLHGIPLIGGLQGFSRQVPPWQEGYFDLHHLHVGSSVSTFCIFPDGTTMVIDAGDVNVQAMERVWSDMGPPWNSLRLRRPYPSAEKSPVGWIVDYLQHFWPQHNNIKNSNDSNKTLDYVLLTHFHSDHMGDGAVSPDRSRSSTATEVPTYILSGIPELAHRIGIRKLIDRGFPTYNVPGDLKSFQDASIDNYLRFVEANQHRIAMEQFQVGSTTQIRQQYNQNDNNSHPYPFQVRVLKANLQVVAVPDDAATTPMSTTTTIGGDQPWDEKNGHGNENVLSAALVMQYGNFRYYEGADQEVIRNAQGEIVLDTIGPTARAAGGRVHVATLNHHGHGVTQDYVDLLDPVVMVLQGWSSDQPPTRSIQLLAQQKQRQIFATDIFEERLQDMGPSLSKFFTSTSGHILVRAHRPSPSTSATRSEQHQTFEIYVLDGQRKVKSHHGPYQV